VAGRRRETTTRRLGRPSLAAATTGARCAADLTHCRRRRRRGSARAPRPTVTRPASCAAQALPQRAPPCRRRQGEQASGLQARATSTTSGQSAVAGQPRLRHTRAGQSGPQRRVQSRLRHDRLGGRRRSRRVDGTSAPAVQRQAGVTRHTAAAARLDLSQRQETSHIQRQYTSHCQLDDTSLRATLGKQWPSIVHAAACHKSKLLSKRLNIEARRSNTA